MNVLLQREIADVTVKYRSQVETLGRNKPGQAERSMDRVQDLDSKRHTVPVKDARTGQEQRVVDTSKKLKQLNSRLKRLTSQREDLSRLCATTTACVKAVLDGITKQSVMNDFRDSFPTEAGRMQEFTSKDSFLGLYIHFLLQRVTTGNNRLQFPPKLVQFALAIANSNHSAYVKLRELMPGLPSISTIIRANDAAGADTGSTSMTKNMTRLRAAAAKLEAEGKPCDHQGGLQNDEMNIQNVSEC